ncbi:hypothetical protein I203_106746 [Kwoniella mangroviensis CBS 8507]|uniref:uncharacterized protein n=1 Tax=Kwoniella mangroviensis CBS 8507 TaxID=1296122 RepID=UPI00080CEFC2|nr:uncharacterized protein I203_07833 [Kwoniella mangroviensis CBS 8507]OCF63097.1 hypothetical protein I203_07833 [Kwoniella mangroviensis CBS 8507]
MASSDSDGNSSSSRSSRHHSGRSSSPRGSRQRPERDGKKRSTGERRRSDSGRGEESRHQDGGRSEKHRTGGRESSSRGDDGRSSISTETDRSRGNEIARRCSHFRYYILFTSGGWLGNFLITLSDMSGIWEFTFLSILFVISWTLLRISQVEITLILGKVFDLVIPLQHKFDPHKISSHSDHLQQYWPIFLVGTIIEFGSFILIHPDLFTLVACFKTLLLTSLWLGVDGKGRFLTEKLGGRNGRSTRSDQPSRRNRPRGDRQDRDRGKDRDRDRPDRNRRSRDEAESDSEGKGRGKRSDHGKNGENDSSGQSEKTRNSASTPSTPPTPASTTSSQAQTPSKQAEANEGGEGDSRDPYDSKGFKGNLMPIRKKAPNGPRQSRRQRH